MKKLLVISLLIVGCRGPSGYDGYSVAGPKGDTGATGATGAQGQTGAQGAQGNTGAAGQNGTNGTNGQNGTNGHDGVNGQNGTDANITTVQFCQGVTPTYPSTFPELGFCINNELYAVYSANNGFLVYLPPGRYSSNGINATCTFSVLPNCIVHQ